MRTWLWLLALATMLLAFGCKQEAAKDEAKKEEAKPAAEADVAPNGGTAKAGEQPTAAPDAAVAPAPAADVAAAPVGAATVNTAAADVAAFAPGAANPFLGMIPAETPYLFASVTTMPFEEVPMDLASWMPFYEGLAKQLEQADPAVGKILGAVLAEFKGKMTKEGLESLGFATEGHMALYGVGVWPVLRMQLKDGAAFDAMIGRVEAAAGLQIEKRTQGAITYRAFPLDDMLVTATVLPNQLVVTLVPAAQIEWQFGYVFGDKKPEKVLDVAVVDALAKTYTDAKGVSVGYLDLRGIEQVLVGDAKNLVSESLVAMGAPVPLPQLAGDCKTEMDSLSEKMPRIVFASGLRGDSSDMTMTIEVKNPTLLGEMKALRAPVPGVGGPVNAALMADIGIALDVKAGATWLATQGKAIQDAPFKCELLGFMNEAAGELAKISEMEAQIPAIKGLHVSLKDLVLEGGMPSKLDVLALIAGESGEALWQAVTKMVPPEVAQMLPLKAGEVFNVPAELTAEVPFVKEPAVLLADKGIAIAMGTGVAAEISAYASAEAPAEGPLASMSFDYGKLMSMIGQMPDADPMMKSMGEQFASLGMTTMQLGVSDAGIDLTFKMVLQKK